MSALEEREQRNIRINWCTRMLKRWNPRRICLGLFPILQWSKTYDIEMAVGDIVAGVTVALTLIPQAMANAALAGMEPQYGLYASFTGAFVYTLMGTCPQINTGPSALLALLILMYTEGTNPDFPIMLAFVGGFVQLAAGITQLAYLVEFISAPVVSGFTSAAAIMIASAQIKGLLGLKFRSNSFRTTWLRLFEHFKETRMPDALLSLACCILLVGMEHLKKIPIKQPPDERGKRKAKMKKKILWFLGLSRNAVLVCLATIVGYLFHKDVEHPLLLTGKITPGLPTPRVPAFESVVDDKKYTLVDMLSYLGSGLLVLPMVSILINVAIAKAFAKGKQLDATQEIVALGTCNVVSSFFQSMPISGSFSRSAVSDASGVRTPAAGLYTGLIVILTLVTLTPYFYFIPRSALASVIVCAVLSMVEIGILKRVWRVNRIDLIPLVGCFFCCLALGIEVGLLCGVAIDILLLLFYQSRPPLDIKYVADGTLPPHFTIRPVGRLNFASAESVRSKVIALKLSVAIPVTPGTTRDVQNNTTVTDRGMTETSNDILVVYCEELYRMDYTFVQCMKMLVQDWSLSGQVVWCNANPILRAQLKNVLKDPIFCDTEHLKTFLTNAVGEQSRSDN